MFRNSFVCDGEYSHEDIQSMVETCINIEYDVDAIDTIVPERLMLLKKHQWMMVLLSWMLNMTGRTTWRNHW